jgi:aerobic-type carbon monoxide dehydrogenase small subunit (CoxS/CutS family)
MELMINGRAYTVPDEQASEPLVWVLRDTLGLVGTRYGCGAGACGSCNVLVNGDVVRSCQALTETLKGKDITTLEGLSDGQRLHPVQQAFLENPLQCCWCMSGHIINAVALLERTPKPDEAQIDDAMNENYCRCGGYNNIRNNVARAAQILAGETRGGA